MSIIILYIIMSAGKDRNTSECNSLSQLHIDDVLSTCNERLCASCAVSAAIPCLPKKLKNQVRLAVMEITHEVALQAERTRSIDQNIVVGRSRSISAVIAASCHFSASLLLFRSFSS